MIFCEKYKALILKYMACILKYMACIFYNKPYVFFRWLTSGVCFPAFGGLQPLCFLHICMNFVDGWERKSFGYDGNFLTLYVI